MNFPFSNTSTNNFTEPQFSSVTESAHHSIRLLTRDDAAEYQKLRLHSLEESPAAFLSTFDNETKLHEEVFADHLDMTYHPPHLGYFGIFVGERLAGYVQISKNYLEKQDHIVFANNLYISPDFRGQGLAVQLFEFVFLTLKNSEHIERIFLSCTARNRSAMRLYKKIGFRRYGVKVRAIKWQGQYDDEVEMVKVLSLE
jgi:RimJ/RimL family protein N-acetyltransferase